MYLLMLLPVIYLIVFKYVPMYGALIAFKNYVPTKGVWGSDWVGFKHFIRFFNSYEFGRIMRNTLLVSFYSLLAGFPFPIVLALCLNYVKSRFLQKSVQMITYAPHFISVVVMVGIVLQFLDPRIGLINMILQALGFSPMNFMGEPGWFSHIFVWSGIWQNVGFSCIIYLAALAAIDPSLHEAAVMDGASKVRRMWHVDLPGIMPVAVIMLIMNTGHVLDIGFEKILLMQNPLNMSSSEVIDTFVYKVGLASTAINYSYSSAIGLFKSVINLVLLVVVNRAAKKMGQTSLW
ncbi:MAG: sugar transporter permease [Paenibacillus sp.]|nr:sugar transporter permease [Paenibacillus sp.]